MSVNIKSCAACTHWTTPDTAYEWGPVRSVFGKCQRTPFAYDMEEWGGEDDIERVLASGFEDRTAAVTDASGYSASLLTKAEHYCSMFSPAPSTGGSHD